MASQWFSEEGHQKFLFDWVDLQFKAIPELALLFAIPNGGLRHPAVAAMLKRTGVRAGVPDLFLPVARGPWHGLFIEMKRPAYPLLKKPAGTTDPDQEKWLERLDVQGYCCWVCWGWEDARNRILEYLAS
jgi:hypothetical protein